MWEKMMENIDSIFYYDKVEFAKTVGEEIGFNNGKNKQLKVLKISPNKLFLKF